MRFDRAQGAWRWLGLCAAVSMVSACRLGESTIKSAPGREDAAAERSLKVEPRQVRRNLALRRATYQSSAANFDNTAQLATDGDARALGDPDGPNALSSEWLSSASDPQWLYVDLGATSLIDAVRLVWGAGYAVSYQIDVSDDRVRWQTVYSTAAGDGGVDDVPIARTAARFVRMLGTQRATAGSYALVELEVYGTGGVIAEPAAPPSLATDQGVQSLSGTHWKVQRASLVHAPGTEVSRADFADASWLVARVPGTVLGSFLEAGAIADPNFGDQQLAISDAFFTADFWYRDRFQLASSSCGRTIWLNLDGINWKADVFLNGAAVASVQGAFRRGMFDVTGQVHCGAVNTLAILIHKNDNPGPVTQQTLTSAGPNGGVLGADNPTIHASAGWDWLPTIRGRNIGILDDVYLSTSGDVVIVDPFVRTRLPLPATSPAQLTVELGLRNLTRQAIDGVVTGMIAPGSIQFSRNVHLAALEEKTLRFDASTVPALSVPDPRLWWPNGYGSQDMYNLELSFDSAGTTSDRKEVSFGIREITGQTKQGALSLQVNGKRIFLRGGNWGLSESLLRLDREGYDTRVRLHQAQNFTMIRNWVGMTGRDDFYAACDKYGILVWDDFWLANPFDGPSPHDSALFLDSAREKIKRVRNHPSLALYCGRNEGTPPGVLAPGLRKLTAELDGTRPYIPNSASGVVSGGGPYSVRDPAWYFKHVNSPKIHSEIGLPNVSSLESLRSMLPEDKLWPINDMWGLHDYADGAQGGSLYTAKLTRSYGRPTGLEDFIAKAQLTSMESYKAIFEARASARSHGVLLWMSLAAWPSLVWQTFDYYMCSAEVSIRSADRHGERPRARGRPSVT